MDLTIHGSVLAIESAALGAEVHSALLTPALVLGRIKTLVDECRVVRDNVAGFHEVDGDVCSPASREP